MKKYATIEDIAETIKANGINVDGFFLAVELKIKRRKIKVTGIIKENNGHPCLFVKNGIKRDGSPKYDSYDYGTKVISIL